VIAALSGGVAISLYQARLASQRFDLVRTLGQSFPIRFSWRNRESVRIDESPANGV
jgi:hypothetical protein